MFKSRACQISTKMNKLEHYFSTPVTKPKLGRPRGSGSKKRRKKQAAVQAAQQAQSAQGNLVQLCIDHERAVAPNAPASRVNWSLPENQPKLTAAVTEWFSSYKGQMSLVKYAERVQIPRNTLAHYCHPDPAKRRALGSQTGRTPLMSAEDLRSLTQVTSPPFKSRLHLRSHVTLLRLPASSIGRIKARTARASLLTSPMSPAVTTSRRKTSGNLPCPGFPAVRSASVMSPAAGRTPRRGKRGRLCP
jgi:hypothetical protein